MSEPACPAKKNILVVDDDASIRHMLCRILSDEGYAAMAAADGDSALKLLSKERADLVLLDLKMPGMSGQEVLSRLSATRPKLPVVVMTAFTQSVFGGDFAGASAWLQKPLDFPALLEVVHRLTAPVAAGNCN